MQLPSITEIQGWSTEELIEHLQKNLRTLSASDFKVFEDQKIDGETFLDLNQEELERWGILGGPAKKIIKYANKLKGTRK